MVKKNFNLLVLPSVLNMQQVIDKFPFPISLTKGRFKDLEIIIQDGQVKILHKKVDIREFIFVWLCSSWGSRDMAYAVQCYLERQQIPHTPVEKSISKITDHMIFALNGILAPDTVYIGQKDVEMSLDLIRTVCGYPLVIKDSKGLRGTNLVYISTEAEFIKKMKELPRHKKFFFQRYIANEYDWGIMVADGVVVSGERSYPCVGEFRNNACNGAKEVFVDPAKIPSYIKQIAIDSSNALGLAWSRSDIIVDKNTGKAYVLEVNRLPGITPKTSEVEGAYTFLSSQIFSSINQDKLYQRKII